MNHAAVDSARAGPGDEAAHRSGTRRKEDVTACVGMCSPNLAQTKPNARRCDDSAAPAAPTSGRKFLAPSGLMSCGSLHDHIGADKPGSEEQG